MSTNATIITAIFPGICQQLDEPLQRRRQGHAAQGITCDSGQPIKTDKGGRKSRVIQS